MGRHKSPKTKQQNTKRPTKTVAEFIEEIQAEGGTPEGMQSCINGYGCSLGLQCIRKLFSTPNEIQTTNFNTLMLGVYLSELNQLKDEYIRNNQQN